MQKASSGDPLTISAKDWNRLCDLANSGAVGAVGGDSLPVGGGVGINWVWGKNTTGSDRTRFDCMSLGSLVFNLETNAQQDLVFELAVADANKPPAILLEPIANGQYGRVCISGVCFAKVATAASTTLLYGTPSASGHNLSAGASGPAKLLAAPSASAETLRPVLIPSNTEALTHWKAPGSGIPAGTTTQLGSATCTRYSVTTSGAKTLTEETATIYNDGGDVASNADIVVGVNYVGLRVVVVERC